MTLKTRSTEPVLSADTRLEPVKPATRFYRPAGAVLPKSVFWLAAFAAAILIVPIIALFARIDWTAMPATLSSPAAIDALLLSLFTASIATASCLVLGIPLALFIARTQGFIASVLRAFTTLPLVLPPLVSGMALLSLFGRTGLLGGSLSALGISIPFTTLAVIIAQTFVALPFLVIAVEGALRSADSGFERTAEMLGAKPARVLFTVTLPLITPSLMAGTILCFTRALGEFGATALFAGNAAGSTRTMPLAIYTAFNGAGVTTDTAAALSLILVLVAIGALLLLRGSRSKEIS